MGGFYICGFPHGVMSVYAMILSISCSLLCISASWGCYYLVTNFTLQGGSAEESYGNMGVGLFSFEDKSIQGYTCRAYSSAQIEEFGPTFETARAFGILTNVLLGLCMVFFIALSCCGVPTILIKGFGLVYFMAAISLCFSFLIFGSGVCDDHKCTFNFGAGLTIICALVSLVNSCIACNIPEEGKDIEVDFFGAAGPRLMVVDRQSVYGGGRNKNNKKNIAPREEQIIVNESDVGEDPPPIPAVSSEQPSVVPSVNQQPSYLSEPTTTETEYPDGSRSIITTIFNADGSRTVEETTIGV